MSYMIHIIIIILLLFLTVFVPMYLPYHEDELKDKFKGDGLAPRVPGSSPFSCFAPCFAKFFFCYACSYLICPFKHLHFYLFLIIYCKCCRPISFIQEEDGKIWQVHFFSRSKQMKYRDCMGINCRKIYKPIQAIGLYTLSLPQRNPQIITSNGGVAYSGVFLETGLIIV